MLLNKSYGSEQANIRQHLKRSEVHKSPTTDTRDNSGAYDGEYYDCRFLGSHAM